MWDPEPWLQLHLLALCKNGLHRYNCNKDRYKLFYKPAPYLYIIRNWFLENTHKKNKKIKERTYNSIWRVLCNLSLLTTEQNVETRLRELEEIKTKTINYIKIQKNKIKNIFIHDKLQFKLSFMSSLNVKRTRT